MLLAFFKELSLECISSCRLQSDERLKPLSQLNACMNTAYLLCEFVHVTYNMMTF